MNPSKFTEFFGLPSTAKRKARRRHSPLRFESLEDRRLLTAANLLIATYNSTGGHSVIGYSTQTDLRLAGSALTADISSGHAQGMAVAPDGSYYVSDAASFDNQGQIAAYGSVVHFSSTGVKLGVLGANDTTHATIVFPGTLKFGPDGNLYVADLGSGAIYQFNTASTTQQYQAADTIYLNSDYYGQFGGGYLPGFTPGGFTFAYGTSNVIVGDLDSGTVMQINTDYSSSVLVPGSDGIVPASILALSNGDLLIADLNLAANTPSSGHHQVVKYSATDHSVSTYINISTPLATGTDASGDVAGAPSQPESLTLDADGNLLVGVSPDENNNGAVQKYDISGATPEFTTTVVSGIGTPTALALYTPPPSDLLITTFDSTQNDSLVRYSDSTHVPEAGGALSAAIDNAHAQGLAVAPDGSYYVSQSATFDNLGHITGYGGVVHFSSAGVKLGVLGANDTSHAPLVYPGALNFGPDGNLYVADLASGAIYQFNTASTAQQYQAAGTIYLNSDYYGQYGLGYLPGFTPGGFTFAYGTSNLIVGDLDSGTVMQINTDSSSSVLVPGTAGITPASILALGNGDLLIADLNLAANTPSSGHHEVVKYSASNQTVSQFINITTPLATGTDASGDVAGAPSQPESLLLDADGNLLVAVSPDHNNNGAVLKYDISGATPAFVGTVASGIGTPTGLALVAPPPSDLVISTFDSTNNDSTIRYRDSTYSSVAGGALSAAIGNAHVQGLAVAPDGSYYVSVAASFDSHGNITGYGSVVHFSNNGVKLGVLGANDASPATIVYPGALKFGPDGNLYVADLGGGALYQFDTNSTTQQYQAADTLYLNSDIYGQYGLGYSSGFTPGGFTFALGTSNLIVGDLDSGAVVQFNTDQTNSVLVQGTAGITPASILALSNGDLLIADLNLAANTPSSGHHQVVKYSASSHTVSQFINITTPLATGTDASGDVAGAPSQPESLLLDNDGNLLVGVSPDHNSNGAVQKYNIDTGAFMATVASGIGTPTGLAFAPALVQVTVTSANWTSAGLTIADSSDSQLHVYTGSTTTDAVGTELVRDVSGLFLTGGFAGPGGLTKTDSGTATLSGTNTYTGATTVAAGTLKINGAGALAAGATLVIGTAQVSSGSVFLPPSATAPTDTADSAAPSSPLATSSAMVFAAPKVDVATTSVATLPLVASSAVASPINPPVAQAAAEPIESTSVLPTTTLSSTVVTNSLQTLSSPRVTPVPSSAMIYVVPTQTSNDGDATRSYARLAAFDAVLSEYGNV